MEKPQLKQSPVVFKSDTHQYFLGDKELKGITQTLISRAFPDTYKKPDFYTDEQWQEILSNAAAKGSVVHETIELYDELGVSSDLPELQSYMRIMAENGFSVLTTEYVVSDEINYATAIDKVVMDSFGNIYLIDFKRTFDLHIDNVTLQQSLCKRWFEKLNPDLKVSGIYVMWLRDDKSKFIRLTPWADEPLDELIEADLNDKSFDIQKTFGELPARVYEVQEYLSQLDAEVKEKTEKLKQIKDGLCNMMLDRGIKKFSTDILQMTTVVPKPKKSFDSKTFAAEHPDLYEKYLKESEASPSIRITYK